MRRRGEGGERERGHREHFRAKWNDYEGQRNGLARIARGSRRARGQPGSFGARLRAREHRLMMQPAAELHRVLPGRAHRDEHAPYAALLRGSRTPLVVPLAPCAPLALFVVVVVVVLLLLLLLLFLPPPQPPAVRLSKHAK